MGHLEILSRLHYQRMKHLSNCVLKDHTILLSNTIYTQNSIILMSNNKHIECPVENCSFTGTISSVAHHISDLDDKLHGWEALEFQHSWDFRKSHANDSRQDTPIEGVNADTSYKSTHSSERAVQIRTEE